MTNSKDQAPLDGALVTLLRAAGQRAKNPDGGLFGLSLDQHAILCWKGVAIDPMSYPQGWAHIFENEALRLAAACTHVERNGEMVSSETVASFFKWLGYAAAMPVPRYVAAWSLTNKLSACKIVVRKVDILAERGANAEAVVEQSLVNLRQELEAELELDRRFVNGSAVCSSLQKGVARASIRMDMEWAARALVMRGMASRVEAAYLRELDAQMADDPPVSYWEIERHHLHPLMADLAEERGPSMMPTVG